MAEVLPLPNPGGVFDDVRDGGRGMRVSYHPDVDVLVISLWSGRTCRATFQLAGAEVSRLSELLAGIVGTHLPPQQAPEPPTPERELPTTEGGGSGPVALAS
jgi:hypothetical protein